MTSLTYLFLLMFSFTTLQDLVWKNRIVIYSGEGDSLNWQGEGINQGLEDRRLLYFFFQSGRIVQSNYEGTINESSFLKKLPKSQQKEGGWVLIGLDGGVKNMGNSMPEVSEIFRLIDSMPMRQSEIKRQKSDGF